jgi:predicted alpha-1,2-mannosidase
MHFLSVIGRGLGWLALLGGLAASAQTGSDAYKLVDPLIGTAGEGNTFPGASLPFGMMQWSPDSGSEAWYYYKDKKVHGFSLTHLSGAGCPLYGDFPVLPTIGKVTGAAPDLEFEHEKEEARPGYYAVTLANGVRVEITVAERAGIARFTFPAGVEAGLKVDAGGSANTDNHDGKKEREAYGNGIQVKADGTWSGWSAAGGFCGSRSNYKIYVAGRFEKPAKAIVLRKDGVAVAEGVETHGKKTSAWFDFGGERQVVLKMGLSYVSEKNARENLDKEIAGWDFDAVHAKARTTWSELLGRLAVEGGTDDQRKIFYTGVYHSFLAPNVFRDENGQYEGFDNQVHAMTGGKQKAQYANFSDWDIYRNTVQLQALFEPERESDMMQSLVNDAVESGWYPRWAAANDTTYVMGGDSPVILLASSYAFGAKNFDVETALRYMVKAGTEPGKGPHDDAERPFLESYRKLGYVGANEDSIDASRTLEFANADFAIGEFAEATGHAAEAKAFRKQAGNWENLFDPETKWIRPRNADGTWLKGFDAEKSLPKRPDAPVSTDQYGFEEGNTYQYTFMLPFDYPALFKRIGGDEEAGRRLDKFFSKLICWGEPCFNMANEPDFVTPYAYVFAGMPWKTQSVVSRIEAQTFKTTPDGIPGNDDLGATSGVYVWNALGFYPAVPGVGGVLVGTPMFTKATLQFAGGRTVVVSRKGPGIYVQDVAVNGKPYANSWMQVGDLEAGTTRIEFTMGEKPNMERGKSSADRPPVFRED